MSTKHTPGLWRVLQVGNMWGIAPKRAKRGDDDICSGSTLHADWEANARLISAAPDLLAALDSLLDEYTDELADRGQLTPTDAIRAARAAIAKATGAA